MPEDPKVNLIKTLDGLFCEEGVTSYWADDTLYLIERNIEDHRVDSSKTVETTLSLKFEYNQLGQLVTTTISK